MKPTKFISHKGAGGFGNVDVVEVGGQHYALKTFSVNHPGGLDPQLTENVKKRFKREAQVQAKLQHPNIVQVIDMDLTSEPPSYLMALADSTLQEDISKDRTLGGNFLSVVVDILTGLEELHSVAITHRDLKPQNVLNFKSTYAISDFGLISLKETQISVLTSTGMVKGSDFYTAPEITADLAKASAQSDIYSVGCILHDMVGTKPRVPCSEIDDVGEYADIIRCCTRVNPSRRFASVAALREALLQVSSSASTATEPKAVSIIQSLSGGAILTDAEWQKLVNYVEDKYSEPDAQIVLREISHESIVQLIGLNVGLASRLGIVYSNWVGETSFVFSDCDGISDRLELFMGLNDPNCSVDVLLALLRMGTRHNRWHVERKFANRCGAGLDQVVAKRLALELRILDRDACRMIAHLEGSIGVSRTSFHPLLVEALINICA